MALANNGILICAMFLAYGLVRGDAVSMAIAFAMAGLSYVANLIVDVARTKFGDDGFGPLYRFVVTIVIVLGFGGYFWIAYKLIRGIL